METIDRTFVHPEEAENLAYWSKKWHISSRALKDAILETGSLRTRHLKDHIYRDSWAHHPLTGLKNLTSNFVHSLF